MRLAAVQRILGLLLMLFSFTLVPPILVSIIYQDGAAMPFIDAFLLTIAFGTLIWLPVRRRKADLRLRDGFLVVVGFWTVLGLVGALPLYLTLKPDLGITDAVFESISGLTTTGATVIVGLDELPKSILFYRQELQWLGGMGIIVLAVAILPMLGIGGMQLYRAEMPGPSKDTKLTPRITETAKALWYIYLGLTIACAVAYWAVGMSPFDAIAHSFSTVAIGGFSTYDASMGHFNSYAVEAVAVVFMVISGMNFALHFYAVRRATLHHYFQDYEFRAYVLLLGGASTITVLYLYFTHTYGFLESLHHGIFQAVSIGTTAGFTTAEYFNWPGFLPVMLLFASFIGGCAGSTGGGMKVIRVLLLYKQGLREMKRLLHPNARIAVKIGNKPLPDRVVDAVWGFFSAYVLVFSIMLLLLMASGLDQVTAFSAVAACINNLGPGLGEVGANFASINDFSKWVLVFAMLLGRLEIFTLLVLLTRAFWDR